MSNILGPRVNQAIMGAFFNHPGYEGHVRAVARNTRTSPAAASKALAALERDGILESRMIGRSKVFRLRQSDIARSAQDLYAKTAGIEGTLRQEMVDLPGAQGVYIIGSYASGTQRPDSDVDLLIVGAVDRESLSRRIRAVEFKIGREVNSSTLSVEEFVRGQSGFAKAVRDRPKIALKALRIES